MSRIKLSSGDTALLERLSHASLEIGNLPSESIARLAELGLVRTVLGSCEITRAGQLSLRRQRFLKTPNRRFVRITKRNPLFLQELRFGAPVSRSGLFDILKIRRKMDRRIRQAAQLPSWLAQLAPGPTDELHVENEPALGSGARPRTRMKP